MLSEQRSATKENVQRKQARIEGERGDSDNEVSASESEEEEEDDIPYNPKNLPLGWDGKVRIKMSINILFEKSFLIIHFVRFSLYLIGCINYTV